MNGKIVMPLAVALACASCAAADFPPAPLRDKGRTPAVAVRQYDVPGFANGQATGLICPIRFVDPYFGYLSKDKYGLEHKAPLSMQCHNSGESLTEGMAVRRDEASGTWTRSIENRYGPPESDRERRELENAIHLHPLSAVNATGFAYTEDDLMGEKSGRRRVLHYCLLHPPKALCGSGEMGYIEDIKRHPRNDLTPYALKILRSIELLDEPGKADGAAPPASSPH